MIPHADERLMQAFSFNAEDLASNQLGMLTARQRRIVAQYIRIARSGSLLSVLAIMGSLTIFVGVFLFADRGQVPQQMIPYLLATAGVLIILFGIFTGIGLRRLRPLQEGKISTVEGRVHLSTKSFGRLHLTGYYAAVDSVRFQLGSERQFKALADKSVYRIHYIHYPPTQLILSVVKPS